MRERPPTKDAPRRHAMAAAALLAAPLVALPPAHARAQATLVMSLAPPPAPTAPGHAAPPLAVTERRPGPEDGRPAFEQDQHWLDNEGRTWAMRDQVRDAGAHGSAMWLYQEPAALPLDQIGGQGLVAAYGTRRLSAGYAGPAMNLVRRSDGAALDVGFLPGGALDETLLAGFCAGTECRVARWYDQGGGGNDATQDQPTSRPAVRLSHRVGTGVSLIWDFEMTSGAPPRWLDLPRGVALDTGAMGLLWTGRFHNSSMISPLLELGTDANPFGLGFWDAHGDFYVGEARHLGQMPGHAALTPGIGLVSVSPGGAIGNYRNRLTDLGAVAGGRHAGGFIGRTAAFGQYGMMELSSLILYARPLTPADRFFGLQSLGETFGIAQQQQDTFVVDGDSLTQGIASLYLQSYGRDLERLLPPGFVFYDAAWAGKTLGGPDGLVARFPTFVAPLFNPNARRNVLSVLAGGNDLAAGQGAGAIMAQLRRYAAEARKAGFRLVVCTVLPERRFTPQAEAERRTLNALITAGWREFADAMVDLAADPVLGPVEALGNGNVYISDGIHLTDYGYQTLASDMAGVVSGLMR